MCIVKEELSLEHPLLVHSFPEKEISRSSRIKQERFQPAEHPKSILKLENKDTSWIFRFLIKSSQFANVLAMVLVLFTGYIIVPSTNKYDHSQLATRIITVCYLLSYISHFGSQIWMTFVSGLVLFFGLPRHTFGKVQIILFPVYFLVTSILSLISLIAWLHMPQKNLVTFNKQTATMVLCFWIEFLVLIYLAPKLIKLYGQKLAMEEKAGVGMEVGHYDPGALRGCPHYNKIHRGFRKIHMSIAILNIATMICNCYHFIHLTTIMVDHTRVLS